LQRFDSIQEGFAFISKSSFCDLPNWEYDANTFKHSFKQAFFFFEKDDGEGNYVLLSLVLLQWMIVYFIEYP